MSNVEGKNCVCVDIYIKFYGVPKIIRFGEWQFLNLFCQRVRDTVYENDEFFFHVLYLLLIKSKKTGYKTFAIENGLLCSWFFWTATKKKQIIIRDPFVRERQKIKEHISLSHTHKSSFWTLAIDDVDSHS